MFDSRRALDKLSTFTKQTAHIIIGEFRWRPPAWLGIARDRASKSFLSLTQEIKRQPRRSLAITGLTFALVGCLYLTWRWYEGQPKPVEFAFTYTAPEITCYRCDLPGKPNPLVVTFAGSTAPLDRAGHTLAKNSGVVIQPEIAGSWAWDDDRTLTFQPSVDWPIDTAYKVKFARRGFAAPEVHLREYSLEFRTPPFAANIANTEFYQDPVVARNKKVVTTIAFSHPV
ncbi:MAG TPA: hypothetical protein VET48_08040, partial [Steroidobacteraceae bacterium]|nr:hypothetical protein [Steroidobacteraceae bacterium]